MKTVSTSVKEAIKLADAAAEKNVSFYCFYNYTGYPMIREAKTLINEGVIGNIISVESNMLQQTFLNQVDNSPVRPQEWRLKDMDIPCVSLDLGGCQNLIEFVCSKRLTQVTQFTSLGNFQESLTTYQAMRSWMIIFNVHSNTAKYLEKRMIFQLRYMARMAASLGPKNIQTNLSFQVKESQSICI